MTDTKDRLRLILSDERTRAPELPEVEDIRISTYDGPSCIDEGNVLDIDLPTGSVALVVTSPPSVEEHADRNDISPSNAWATYRQFLAATFAEIWRVLEPGGRLAFVVNPASNSPFLPIAAHATSALQIARFQLRGEVVWAKSDMPLPLDAGVLRGPHNPPIVGVTERILLASKMSDHRRNSQTERRSIGMPSENSITAKQWAENRLDIWPIPAPPPGEFIHHDPFPIELARRLIETHTYEGDLVCDPMCGTGTTAIAAQQLGRRHYAIDIDPEQVDLANQRSNNLTTSNVTPDITNAQRRHPASTQLSPSPKQLGLDFDSNTSTTNRNNK